MWENVVETDRPQYGGCALHVLYLKLQTHTRNMQYLLLSHYNNRCTQAPERYVIITLAVLLKIEIKT